MTKKHNESIKWTKKKKRKKKWVGVPFMDGWAFSIFL